ncbi:MAG: hypothetical protein NZM42_03315 [Gemmatales bacterium]|nr:hypothetical protein [Gemmatales bacterium]
MQPRMHSNARDTEQYSLAMNRRRIWTKWLGLAMSLVATLSLGPSICVEAQAAKGQRLTRLFYHDDSTCTLRWADVMMTSNAVKLQLTQPVAQWPKVDPSKQHLTQLVAIANWLLSGLHDSEQGKFGSGWMLTYSAVRRIPHGDHEDWRYDPNPFVADYRLDDKQGNPAHVYAYNSVFYVANDLLSGYTRIAPRDYEVRGNRLVRKGRPHFIPGGGNHITLAVDRDRVGYACWIDNDGENKGRVDVSVIQPNGASFILYTFNLPWGALHGATINSGKVFVAPEENVVWFPALADVRTKPESITYHVVDLGKENGQPLRTGAFADYKNYVLFVTGRSKPMLGIINAAQSEPQLVTVSLSARQGLRPVTPKVVATHDGKVLALVCHDKPGDAQMEEILDIVSLDPDGDGSFHDAKLVHTLTIGPSAVQGHFGHHHVTADADGRFAFVTNPGNGTIQAIRLSDFNLVATWTVGGKPSDIVAIGGLEEHHH